MSKNITLQDLVDLGTIKTKKRKNKSKKRRNKKLQNKRDRGYNIGGFKSDSSHMVGYGQNIPMANTANISTEIQHLQRKLLVDQKPERFEKQQPQNNLLTHEQFKNFAGPVLNRFI